MDGYGQQTPALADTHVEPMEKASCVLDKGPCGSDPCLQAQEWSDQQTTTHCSPAACHPHSLSTPVPTPVCSYL